MSRTPGCDRGFDDVKVSIIVRAKNEERWISSCLDAVSRQTYTDFEIVLVDNNSTDKTVDKARRYCASVVSIDVFKPGAAINRGIEESKGEIIVCLSGHCIPVNEHWLANLVKPLEDLLIGGVYGRQEPLAFTSDQDKRDLMITFGLDERIQTKDSFFHNANSAFRRTLWERYPFDEQTTNIEDRIWAGHILNAGFKIFYQPTASVYHHHGIHHNGDPVRCGKIVRILESLEEKGVHAPSRSFDASRQHVVCVIPVREDGLRIMGGKPLYIYAIEHAKRSDWITTVAVSTDSDLVARHATEAGADLIIHRPISMSRFDVILEQLMQSSLLEIEAIGMFPDILVMLEPEYPFRPEGLIDELIDQFVNGGFDTVIPARPEYNSCWLEQDGNYHRVDSGYIARQFKVPFYTGLKGLCCVCSPATVREGRLFGENVGLEKIDAVIAAMEIRKEADVLLAEAILGSSL